MGKAAVIHGPSKHLQQATADGICCAKSGVLKLRNKSHPSGGDILVANIQLIPFVFA